MDVTKTLHRQKNPLKAERNSLLKVYSILPRESLKHRPPQKNLKLISSLLNKEEII